MKINWHKKRLGDVVHIIKGKNPELFKLQAEGMLPYLGAKFMRGTRDAEFAKISDKKSVIVGKEDLIIICDGSKSGDMFSGFEGILSSTMGKMEFNNENVCPGFLKFFLDHNFELFNGSKKGAAIPHLDFSVFKSLEIPLPPLEIQKEIVAKLDEKFEKLREAKKLQEEVLADTEKILSQTLCEIFEEGEREKWEEKTLKEVTSLLGDGLHGTPEYDDSGKYYFINGNNLKDGVIDIKSYTKKVSDLEYQKHRKNLNSRTILVSINGTLGRVAVYNNEPIILGKSACYFNVIESVDKNYIKYLISSNLFLNYAKKLATGSTILNVSLKSMRDFKIPIPSLTQQQKIVERLDGLSEKVKKLRELQISQLEDIKRLEKAYLREAFNGELH